MRPDKIVLQRFDDMHLHLRTGDMLRKVLPLTTAYADRAVIMPNIQPNAVRNGTDVVFYRRLIAESVPKGCKFKPLMTIEIRDDTTIEMVKTALEAGAVAGKVYPRGVTTNSEHGLTDFFSENTHKVFQFMENSGMHLLLHGEIDRERTLVTKREEIFLPKLINLAEMFPTLNIVLEHVSTKKGVETVRSLGDNVVATITAHHLCLTLNDVIGSGTEPHNACMPMPKDFDDRDALIEAATSGNPKFFLGSDSAPHLRENKECAKGACGVFSAPVLPQVLAGVFERAHALDRLADFASRFGAEFYDLPYNEETITLIRKEWKVPEQIEGVVPFRAGATLQWQLL